jgi:hypothetical protein
LGDFTERNPLRFGLVNLQVALYPLVHQRRATNLAVELACGSLCVLWLFLAIKMKRRDDLLCLSAITALTLLCVYHRFYDASLLIIPVCWFFVRAKSSKAAQVGLIAGIAFLVPGGTLLQEAYAQGHLPAILGQSGACR